MNVPTFFVISSMSVKPAHVENPSSFDISQALCGLNCVESFYMFKITDIKSNRCYQS